MKHLLFTILPFFLWLVTSPLRAQQPNIVWLTCEDISPYLAMYGDSTAQTPNLDRLASESTIFTQAFAPVGVCAPSRSSLITGMYPTSIGTQHMRTGQDVMGWGTRNYEGKSGAVDINGDSVGRYSAVIPAEVKCFTEYLRAEGYFCTNNPKTDYQFAAPVTAWDENGPKAHWKNRKENQPFFAVFNANVSHESFLWKNQDKELTVDPAEVRIPPYFPDTDTVRRDVARMYSNIELMDTQIGRRLKELEEAGLMDNTIVFFFSDHGGPLPRGKRLHYESGLRVPFMVRLPKRLKQEYSDQMLSFVDLAPTMLGLAGITPPEYMQGRDIFDRSSTGPEFVFASGDRFDDHTDRVRTVISKDYIYVRNFHPELPAYKDISYRRQIPMMQHLLAMRDQGQLNEDQMYWFRKEKSSEEFYLRNRDPFNLNNSIDDPDYRIQIQQMREAMDEWLSECGDKGAIPEYQLLQQMWPDGKQPQAERPEILKKKGKYQVCSGLAGASIAYLISDEELTPDLDAGWQLYTAPLTLEKGQYLYAMTTRIGYQDSGIVKVRR